jgi:hypothetical protein
VSSLPPPGHDQQRQSHGLQQFFSSFGESEALQVLDLGEFTQANVSYITGLGHRPTFDGLQHTLDSIFGFGDPLPAQSDPVKAQYFLDHVLQFPPDSFDAILVWDTLERLSRPLLNIVLERLHDVLRPHGGMLACFHAESKQEMVQTYSFRIVNEKTLLLYPRGMRKAVQSFNNRAIEKLFERFGSVKFFLTRDYIREVIVRK